MNRYIRIGAHTFRVLAWMPILLLSALTVVNAAPAADGARLEQESWTALHPDEYRDAVLEARRQIDPVLVFYRGKTSQAEVIAFFTAITHSEEIARAILRQSDEYDLPPSLVTALVWEESRFDHLALNKNKGSVDRGLFQLNSKSFPKLKESDFFDIGENTRLGTAHLRWCLDLAGTDVSALAMYNAGTTRVSTGGTPKKTLDYASRILDFKNGLDSLFEQEFAIRWQILANGEIRPDATRGFSTAQAAKARFPILNAYRR